MSRKLRDQLKSEKSSLPYDDHLHKIKKNEEDSTLKSHKKHHKQGNNGRERENEDEMVKYMSNLPGYLQKGRENREKVLNVGVLDWNRLEQWKNSQKHVSHRNSKSSTSSNNASSSVSTNGLSGRCSKGQRTFHPSLQYHFMASPNQDHSQAVKSSTRSVGNSQEFRGSCSSVNKQSKPGRADDHLSLSHPNNRLKGCNRKYLDPNIDKESDIFQKDDQMKEATSCAKQEMPAKDGAMEKRVETSDEPNIDNIVQAMLMKCEPVDHHLPRDSSQNSHCGVPHKRTSFAQKSEIYSRLSYSEEPKDLFRKDPNDDILHSCTHPDELSCNDSQRKGSGCSSTDLESVKLPSSTISSPLSTLSSPFSVGMGISPSKPRQAEERKQTFVKTSTANGHVHELDQKGTSEKSRSSSGFRRLSISNGHTSKESVCKEIGYVPHQSSITAAKSNSENVRDYTSSNISDKPADGGRSRTSPLRRLLDPLLKLKTARLIHSWESSQKDSVLTNKNCKSANGRFSTLHPDKEVDKDHRIGCNPVDTIDSSKDKKHIPSRTQAFLKISVKNGLPLFTFAVDNNDSAILAARVKNLAALGKNECNRIYTFFTFKEVKKKNGSWMNKAGRCKDPDYIPHAVAQMKVSDSLCYDLSRQNCVDSSTLKEFVLFSVKLGEGDVQDTDYQPNNELAAIVVKVPKAISFINDQHQKSFLNDYLDLIHATVVLPGGVHSLPSKGGPSSLLERWKSGGSCDCGGWDLACNLRIIASENQACRKSRPSQAYFADQLDLFVQGSEQDLRPAFSLTPFEHGMCSIAFDSSLTLLQAFAICIALVDSKIPCELSGSRDSIEGKNTRETLLVATKELKVFGKSDDMPASFVSYPPDSPIGRV